MKIVSTVPLTDPQLQHIKEAAPDATLVVAADREALHREVRDADALFGDYNAEVIERAGRLRFIQTLSAGVDHLMLPEVVESDIVVASQKGVVGPPLADQAFGLLLAITRGIARSIREHTWSNTRSIRQEIFELTGLTMGLVGFGGTGREMAKRARAFGMNVLAVDEQRVPPTPDVAEVWGMDRLSDLLAQSDVVSICLPLTPATRGMFNLDLFRQMKQSAILVNVTRGPIMDEASLVTALRDGIIRAAALDVAPYEPLPDDHPLWHMNNVVLTPHVAGQSQFGRDRAVDLFCRNLVAMRTGRPMESVIDKRKGY